AAFFDVPEPPRGDARRLLVLGGSQGARQINRLLPEAAPALLASLPALSILHQAGEAHVDEAREAYQRAGVTERVELVPFLDDVVGAMAASHLLLSRAGAITVTE